MSGPWQAADRIRFGAAYYPEQDEESRWPVDADLMVEAGIDTVRIGEFAWSAFNPGPGEFELDWVERCLDVLGSRGIDVLVGTPTAAAPPWLTTAHPETVRMESRGERVSAANRQHCCINTPAFRAAADEVVGRLAKAVGSRSEVVAWQIDNELRVLCYCPTCHSEFHRWLGQRYADIDALNHAWGTSFWSHRYRSFAEVPLPLATGAPFNDAPNPGLHLDFRRFHSARHAGFLRDQADLVRAHSSRPITHNFMGLQFEELDYYEVAAPLDFASVDNYPLMYALDDVHRGAQAALAQEHTRGLVPDRPYWVAEQQVGTAGWGTVGSPLRPGQVRLWALQAIAHGATGVFFFPWRSFRAGIEQYCEGIIGHDGRPGRRFGEVARAAAEARTVSSLLAGSTRTAAVALVNDPDSRFAFQVQPSGSGFSWWRLASDLHAACFTRGVAVDVVPVDGPWECYDLLLLPGLLLVDDRTIERVRAFVAAGGTVLSTFRSFVKDRNSRMRESEVPAGLSDVFGLTTGDHAGTFGPEELGLSWTTGESTAASVWAEELLVTTATPLATYSSGMQEGAVAATEHAFGAGHALYLGTWPDATGVAAIVERARQRAGVSGEGEAPVGVEIVIRRSVGGTVRFVMNHTGGAVRVGDLELAGYDAVAVPEDADRAASG